MNRLVRWIQRVPDSWGSFPISLATLLTVTSP
jgi:hypothetical protein